MLLPTRPFQVNMLLRTSFLLPKLLHHSLSISGATRIKSLSIYVATYTTFPPNFYGYTHTHTHYLQIYVATCTYSLSIHAAIHRDFIKFILLHKLTTCQCMQLRTLSFPYNLCGYIHTLPVKIFSYIQFHSLPIYAATYI